MKRFVILLVLALISVYGLGRFNLGERGAVRFLTKMESRMNEGDAAGVCAMFHDELEVEIVDHSSESPQQVSGGRKELCDLAKKTIAGLQVLPHSMNVDYTDVKATQKLSNPWTSVLTYSEHRTLSIPGANATLRTVSNDQITLVQTFAGVKLRKVKSELFKAEAT